MSKCFMISAIIEVEDAILLEDIPIAEVGTHFTETGELMFGVDDIDGEVIAAAIGRARCDFLRATLFGDEGDLASDVTDVCDVIAQEVDQDGTPIGPAFACENFRGDCSLVADIAPTRPKLIVDNDVIA